MSSNSNSHPNLVVSVNVNGKLHPATEYHIGPAERYDYEKREYVPGPAELEVYVDTPILYQIIQGDYTLLNNLTSWEEQGERSKILTIRVSDTLSIKTRIPRQADIDCPKCHHKVYSDELTVEWDTAKEVLGKEHYGKVCKACYGEYLAGKAATTTPHAVQSDTSNLHFKVYRCADCGGVVDKENLNIGQDGTGRCEECDTLYKQANS